MTSVAAEWQWSVQIPSMISQETEAHPQAFLWIPDDCGQVKAVVVGQHNMCEETLFENPLFRKRMQEAGGAVLVPENEIEDRDMTALLLDLLRDPERLDRMARGARTLARPEAAASVADEIIKLATLQVG